MVSMIAAGILGALNMGLLYRLRLSEEKLAAQARSLAVLRLENLNAGNKLREARNMAKALSVELADEKAAHSKDMVSLSAVFDREARRAECMAAQLRRTDRNAMVRSFRRKMCMSSAMSAGAGRFCDDHAWRFLAAAALKQVMDDTSALKEAIRRRDRFALAEAAARVSRSAEAFPVIFRYDGNAAFAALHHRDMALDPMNLYSGKGSAVSAFSRVRGLAVKKGGEAW